MLTIITRHTCDACGLVDETSAKSDIFDLRSVVQPEAWCTVHIATRDKKICCHLCEPCTLAQVAGLSEQP